MHEWALAEAVISTAIKVAEEEKFKEITEIKIKLGELQQIEIEIFEFALKEIIQPQ
ncbi:hydrogenase maturation nickel metallochaperone HypA, partial [candidate division WOR-3 bacterium]|nr:hydrogenase maturation nickel metallochaperone HypA [candidate division WOR-3 bacterium]